MTNFHNWTGDEEIAEQVPQFLNDDNAATLEKLDTKFNNSLKITGAADLNSFKDEGLYYCNSNSQAETILNCPTNYAFGLMVWGKEDILYQEVREFNRGSNQDYNNCWRRSYYSEGGQGVWSNWQQMSYVATTLAGYGITDGMSKDAQNSVSTMNIIGRDVNTSYLRLSGGDGIENSAYLQLCGNAYSKGAGQFRLLAADSEHSAYLLGSPSGLLTWNNKNIVRSINNVAADDNGNVNITVGGGGTSITVDAALSSTSTNPVQNKAIYNALLGKVSTDIYSSGIVFGNPTATISWRAGSSPLGSLSATDYTGTAAKATGDAEGNVIVDTYAKKIDISGMVKSVNGVTPDDTGNVTIAVGGGGSGSSGAYLPLTGGTVTGGITATNFQTGTGESNYFQCRKFRGEGNANSYYHAIDFGYSGHDSVDFYEYDPNWNFYKCTTGTKSGAVLVGSINGNGWNGGARLSGTPTAPTATAGTNTTQIATTAFVANAVSGVVKSVNGVQPDTSGNVNITVSGGGSNITVDAELSATSTNPVQNKVIYSALEDKMNTKDIISGFALLGGATNIRWREGTQFIGSINAANYSGTARAATHDGAGNIISETYAKKTDVSGVVKSVNGTKPDASGNVTVTVSSGGGVSTSESNTWTAQQNFHDLMLNREKYTTYVVNGTSDTPVTSTMVYAVTGAFTLNLATLAGALSASQSSVFTAYFAANADYSLTISNAGKLKYVGSASDIAITSAGLLLNIWMSKDGGGTLTSIVQASKLS